MSAVRFRQSKTRPVRKLGDRLDVQDGVTQAWPPETAHGTLFPDWLMSAVKQKFLYVDQDSIGRERLYFDNAGGAFRLKAAVDCFVNTDAIPDNAGRVHDTALGLQGLQAHGAAALRTILNASGGTVYASLTASGAMFEMVRAIAEGIPGTNMVTTALEHPSSFDAMSLYAHKLGRELRVAQSNAATGGVDVDKLVKLVDHDTALLNVMYASNISGAKLDIEEIVRRARAIKPGLYIIVDAVQHAPHGIIDLQRTPVDGINIAPYKFFGCRGSGFSWLSDRAAILPHHKLGGAQEGSWNLGSSAPWQYAVLVAIVDYVCWLGGHEAAGLDPGSSRHRFEAGMEAIGSHERALLSRLLKGSADATGLRNLKHVTVHFDHDDLHQRDLIVAITFDQLDSAEAVREYERRGVIVYERVSTSLYSRRMLESFGLTGAVRISPLHCHSAEDIDRFLMITKEIAEAASDARL
jgi:cysteine desulfurase / selenocysteine lyase